MKQSWTYHYNGNTIVVNNGYTCELWVNGKLQDKQKGIMSANLRGKLESGESINASVQSNLFSINCTMYVNNELLAHHQ